MERLPWLKWIDRFSLGLASIGGAATLLLMVTVVIDVTGRALFNRPFAGTLDLTTYAFMPTAISLGLAYALLRGEHIRVSLLTAPTTSRVQRIIEIIGMTFTLGTTALFILFSVEKAAAATNLRENALINPWIEIWPFRWVVVAGLTGLFLQAVAQLLRAATVAVFVPSDEDEVKSEIASKETVFQQLDVELAADERSPSTALKEKVQ